MFEGFQEQRFDLGEAEIFARVGGEGPPLLLLHGYPQTHATWRLVAPELARDFTLVVPDLRGYGLSRGPGPDPEHRGHSKRVMAADMVAVMERLGFLQFFLAGHDRGGRVAYRLCLDHPDRALAFAAVDLVPTVEVWEAMDAKAAIGAWHWPFLAQPAPLPETAIAAAPEAIVGSFLTGWAGRPDALAPEALALYLGQFARPEVIVATCEDYRAGAGTDWRLDREDRAAGRRLACPVLAAWGEAYLGRGGETPAAVWRRWADKVEALPLPCGHFLQEEAPEALSAALKRFFLAKGPAKPQVIER